jgi:hypothetical protein
MDERYLASWLCFAQKSPRRLPCGSSTWDPSRYQHENHGARKPRCSKTTVLEYHSARITASLVDAGWCPVQATHLDHRSMPASGRWWRLSPLLVIWLRLLPDAGKLRRSIVIPKRPLLHRWSVHFRPIRFLCFLSFCLNSSSPIGAK